MAKFTATFNGGQTFNASMNGTQGMEASFGSVQKIETGDYDKLTNKPKINTVTVQGEKISKDYGLQDHMDSATVAEIESILYLD